MCIHKNKYVLYKALGFNYLLNQDLSNSIKMFKQSIASWPADKTSKDYYILFTTHYFIQNDTVAALKVIDQKIKNDSVLLQISSSDYVLKGNIYLAKGDYENAKYAFQQSLGIAQTPDAWLGLSFIPIERVSCVLAISPIPGVFDKIRHWLSPACYRWECFSVS